MDVKYVGSIEQNFIKANTIPSGATKSNDVALEAKAVKQQSEAKKQAEVERVENNKAVFAIVDDKYVVIQFLDTKGNVVKQIPPKELIAAYERVQETIRSNYDREA